MALKKTFRLAVTLEAGTKTFFSDMKAAGAEVKVFEKTRSLAASHSERWS